MSEIHFFLNGIGNAFCRAVLVLNQVQEIVNECYFKFTVQCLENHNCLFKVT